MLPEVAAEALHFLSRRDLDKASAVSKWLDALVTRCCEVYPLRPVFQVGLDNHKNHLTLKVRIEEDDAESDYSFGSMDEAAQFVGSILRHSYVDELELYSCDGLMILFPRHWAMLVDAICIGAVRVLGLDEDALLVAVGFRGLQSLELIENAVPSGFPDVLVRSSAATGVRELWYSPDGNTPRFSDAAVLDFFFPADAASGGQSLVLRLQGTGISEMFLAKFFERIQSTHARPCGRFEFYGAAEQHGLSAYAHYLAPDEMEGADATYRFPSIDGGNTAYVVGLCETSPRLYIQFRYL